MGAPVPVTKGVMGGEKSMTSIVREMRPSAKKNNVRHQGSKMVREGAARCRKVLEGAGRKTFYIYHCSTTISN